MITQLFDADANTHLEKYAQTTGTRIEGDACVPDIEFMFDDLHEHFYSNYIRSIILGNGTYYNAHKLASSLSRHVVELTVEIKNHAC